MKSRVLKSVYILLAIVAVIDWPVEIEAQGGAKVAKRLGQVVKEEKGLFKSCSHSEEAVNKASHEAGQMNIHPAAVGGAVNAVRNSNSYNNNAGNNVRTTPEYIFITCEDCCGRGVVLYDDYTQETCYSCNGKGKVCVISN